MSTNNSSTWIAELASTMSRPYLNTLLLNTIRDITRSFTLTERQKMHKVRSITEAYDAWQSQTRQSA